MRESTVTSAPYALDQIPTLLRGEPQPIQVWIAERSPARMFLYAGVIVTGTALFGSAVGSWRDLDPRAPLAAL